MPFDERIVADLVSSAVIIWQDQGEYEPVPLQRLCKLLTSPFGHLMLLLPFSAFSSSFGGED